MNARARDPTFEPGDAVFYRNPATCSGLSQKLSMRLDPYCRVIEQTGPMNFRIRHKITRIEHLVHAKYLRACNIQDVWADTPADSESGSDDANGVAHDDIASDFLEERRKERLQAPKISFVHMLPLRASLSPFYFLRSLFCRSDRIRTTSTAFMQHFSSAIRSVFYTATRCFHVLQLLASDNYRRFIAV